MTKSVQDEIVRRHRVADQMISAHSALRDRYVWRALVVDGVMLVLSAVLCALVFAPQALVDTVGVSTRLAGLLVGWTSVGVFALSILQLRVAWKEKGADHCNAAIVLAETKAQLSLLLRDANADTVEQARVLEIATLQGKSLRPIPEGEFLTMKAAHLRKVLLSRLLDRYPFASRLWLHTVLRFRHTRKALKQSHTVE